MEIFIATEQNKEQWDDFVKQQSMGSFLQSWFWGDFNIAYRQTKAWRIVVADNNEWQAVMMVYLGRLRMGLTFLSSPRGPVVANVNGEKRNKILKLLSEKIDQLAKEEKSLYVQVEPYTEDKLWAAELADLGYVKSKDNVMPRYTLILDIDKEPEELLKQMHHKTRYNIRLAKKKGVQILKLKNRLDDFYSLLMETSRRQGITFFSKKYFQELLELPETELYLAEYDGEIVAANIMIFWNDMATYLFGASGLKHRNVMAPHLLQWQAILDAKEKGIKHYDFWGATPEGVTGKEKKWAGVTRFKKGFAPEKEITTYIGTYEKVYRPGVLKWYKIARRLMGV